MEASNASEAVADMAERKIVDHLLGKSWALRLAADAAINILRVDQIIMAKQAGGPKAPKQGPMDG